MKRDFLSLADLSPEQAWTLLERAVSLKQEWREGGSPTRLAGRTLAMVFQKPSLRTRVSFEMAMRHEGGHALYIGPDEIQLGKRESVPDVARVLSRYVDAIMARVFAHEDVVQLARYASVPVINGLSDYSHPCQGLADVLTVYEKLGRLQGARLAYLGDGNNVLHSLLFAGALFGMHIVASTPEGYEPLPEVVRRAGEIAQTTGATITMVRDPQRAVGGAEVVYTDTWTSMGQEAEAHIRRQVFTAYQVNEALLAHALPDAGVMHCLPAHRGEEITDEVADGPNSWLFDQAENRLHAQKAVLVDLLER
ncbi:MAG TPA: ornithine carbamoyltransferase [Chloroflexi bacterium]|jgi:ornithine carbamoyltransferase|nr:ornithine carbamoyltransferase [Chloroflexota bacterium]